MTQQQSAAPALPKPVSTALARAAALAAAQRLEEAERQLARFPDQPECMLNRAAVLITLERWAEAEPLFRRLLSFSPNHIDSMVGLAGSLINQGRAAESIPLLQAALRAQPSAGRLHYFLGIALDECGQGEAADRQLTLARERVIAPALKRDLVPWEVYVQVSRRCNLRCAMCGHEVWKSNSGFMEQDVFDRVIEQCRENGIKTMHILAGQGEPMLNPRIFEMLEQAVAAGLDVGIVTNGTPLTEERCRRLAALDLAYIQFSFAGWDEESYERIYVGAKFQRTLANLRLMQKATRGTRTNFFVKAVCEGDNWAEVRDRTRKFLESHGVEKIFTVTANNFGGNVVHGRLSERHGVWSLKSLEHQRRMPCRVFLKAVGIFCDGTVTACGCYDSNAELKIGNIMETPLAEIRRGETFRRYLEGFRSGNLGDVPMCAKCDDPFG